MPCFAIPRSLDGRGLAHVFASQKVSTHLCLAAIPAKWPELNDWLLANDADAAWAREEDRGTDYRVAVPERFPSGGWRTHRFSLSKGAPKAVLKVLAQHFDEEGVHWLFFTDGNGTRLRGLAAPVSAARLAV